ncbi:hypothetical protein AMTR_s00132p00036820 [Amborella trichopoda]|uniref:Uncharacterized protein n=1 Tax=Amborella trichopoda TaxID=13333 RepID=W1NDF9_AMBTC|nr:hypothetical protein AMTR_s00132p00036820 [Amborella trichopoda]
MNTCSLSRASSLSNVGNGMSSRVPTGAIIISDDPEELASLAAQEEVEGASSPMMQEKMVQNLMDFSISGAVLLQGKREGLAKHAKEVLGVDDMVSLAGTPAIALLHMLFSMQPSTLSYVEATLEELRLDLLLRQFSCPSIQTSPLEAFDFHSGCIL